jgi:hypothetical protein
MTHAPQTPARDPWASAPSVQLLPWSRGNRILSVLLLVGVAAGAAAGLRGGYYILVGLLYVYVSGASASFRLCALLRLDVMPFRSVAFGAWGPLWIAVRLPRISGILAFGVWRNALVRVYADPAYEVRVPMALEPRKLSADQWTAHAEEFDNADDDRARARSAPDHLEVGVFKFRFAFAGARLLRAIRGCTTATAK